MCIGIFKKKPKINDMPNIEDSSPRTDNHTPSPAYLSGKMPTYTIPHLIEHLQFRITIHETYAGLVVQDPSQYPPKNYGSYEYQIWAIEGYENAIHYLRI